ncbi:histidinol-phosphatase HisJ family protein [Velocimicrobium porci]|uniref:Histidinol-phosphatase n=1 Tax=Velocimicrobium porci TaxID=2606634 RepID=A0A6L5XWF2_9FIRM|nr:histidinol-phosphatase HisJ family protein [Velocimicrobium porci]MSS63072.1 histidinol-phosphatase HisJ family protein [Velocimicrobium porci]
MILTDMHVHSSFSSDSDAKIEDLVKEALKRNFSYFYLTDHMDYGFPITDGLDFILDVENYDKTFELLYTQFGEKIKIRKGIEVGIKPDITDKLEKLLKEHFFDFVVGSTHLVNDTDPYQPIYWEGRTEKAGIQDYFEMVLENFKQFNNFDTCAHLDYVVRYSPSKGKGYSYQAHGDIIDEILRYLIQNGKALELNTGGLKYGLPHPNPHTDILKRYRELGGELLTIGSDAHTPLHYAYDFPKIENLLKTLGYRYYSVYEKRKPIQLPL